MILGIASQGSMETMHCHRSRPGNSTWPGAKKRCRHLLRRSRAGTIRLGGNRVFQASPVDRVSFSFVTGEEIMTSAANTWQLGRLHHLGVTVADIDRSIEFYRDILGMELVGRRPCVEADYVAKQTGYPGGSTERGFFSCLRRQPTDVGSGAVPELSGRSCRPGYESSREYSSLHPGR